MTERTRADELAELVCALFGWTPSQDRSKRSERELALHQLWSEWMDERWPKRPRRRRGDYRPSDYPQLSDEYIAALARRREAIEAATNAQIEALIETVPAVSR